MTSPTGDGQQAAPSLPQSAALGSCRQTASVMLSACAAQYTSSFQQKGDWKLPCV